MFFANFNSNIKSVDAAKRRAVDIADRPRNDECENTPDAIRVIWHLFSRETDRRDLHSTRHLVPTTEIVEEL
jgi:hypothetical protein